MRNTSLKPTGGRRLAGTAAVTATVALGLLLVGCTTNSSKSSTSGMSAASASASVGGGDAAAALPSAAPSAAAASSAAAPAGSSGRSGPATSPPILSNRQIIYTADITVRAKNIKSAVSAVETIGHTGNRVVFAEQVQLAPQTSPGQDGGVASATVTLKVPPDDLTSVLNQISALGTELGRNQHADDVTSQVVDVGARLQAAQDSLNRLEQLFQHAGSVADLTNVEAQIAQREADLDSLESQQRNLSAQVAMATVTANLVATPPPAPAAPPAPKKAHVFGFLRGLRGGWHAFTAVVTGLATALGALLPFLGALAVLAAIGFVVWRRAARPRNTGQPPETVAP